METSWLQSLFIDIFLIHAKIEVSHYAAVYHRSELG